MYYNDCCLFKTGYRRLRFALTFEYCWNAQGQNVGRAFSRRLTSQVTGAEVSLGGFSAAETRDEPASLGAVGMCGWKSSSEHNNY